MCLVKCVIKRNTRSNFVSYGNKRETFGIKQTTQKMMQHFYTTYFPIMTHLHEISKVSKCDQWFLHDLTEFYVIRESTYIHQIEIIT